MCADLCSRWRKRLNLNGKGELESGESEKWEEKMIERSTRWRVCEIQKERQTTLLYILEAVGQYLNNSWRREMEFFFFYSGCWTPQAEGLPSFLSPWGQRPASQTAVDYIHLSNLLHLPRCTSCLIHRLCSFSNFSFSSFSEIFMMDGWWISGRRKVRVTRVRGDQIRRLNIRCWRRREEEVVVEKKMWHCAEIQRKQKGEKRNASFTVPYVSMSPRSPACVDLLIHYLHDLRCLESAARKHYKTAACWFLCALSDLPGSRGDWNHRCTHLHGSTECVRVCVVVAVGAVWIKSSAC